MHPCDRIRLKAIGEVCIKIIVPGERYKNIKREFSHAKMPWMGKTEMSNSAQQCLYTFSAGLVLKVPFPFLFLIGTIKVFVKEL